MPWTRKLFSSRVGLLAALFVGIVGAKFLLIDRYGSDLPYWDQWDSEANLLLRPFNEGTLAFKDLFIPHSEHRIFFTKALALGLYVANDRQWDARLEMTANAGLHAAVAVLLGLFALRFLPRAGAWAYLAVLAYFFSTAASWENTLGGFQSQFYFLLLFTVLHLAGSLIPDLRATRRILASLAGAAALAAMASGMFSAAAVIVVLAARALRDRKLDAESLVLISVNAALCLAGVLLQSPAPGNDWARAQGAAAWITAEIHELSWPFSQPWMILLNVAPFLCFAMAWLRRRMASPVTPVLLAFWLWYGFQSAALAYGRAVQEHNNYSFRYTDVRDVGFLAGLFMLILFSQAAASRRARQAWVACAVLLVAAVTVGTLQLAAKGRADFVSALPQLTERRDANVRHYLTTHDPAFLKLRPWDDLPYPLPWRLAEFLENPAIARTLPASVRPPIPWVLTPAAGTEVSAAKIPRGAPAGPPPMALAARYFLPASPSPGSFRLDSESFESNHELICLYVAGDPASDWQMTLIGRDGDRHVPLGGFERLSSNWKRINYAAPAGIYRLEAQVDRSSWIGVSQPFTDTSLSRFANKALQSGSHLLILAGALAIVSFAAILRERSQRRSGLREESP